MGQAPPPFDFALMLAQGQLLLQRGRAYLIGRDRACDLVLEDRMVSRRHALLDVSMVVTLEDLGSSNGVLIDGVRTTGAELFMPGQRAQIGATSLVLVDAPRAARQQQQTVPERRVTPPPESDERAVDTDRVGYVGVLLELSRKLLARGRHDEAEDLIAGSLQAILDKCRQHRRGDAEVAAGCARHAMELAAATGHARWLDYVFELYEAIDELMPDALIDESYRVVHRLPGPSPRVVDAYLSRMESRSGLGAADRFRVKRVRGLAEMMAAR